MSFERFMDSNPKELEPFVEAHKLRLEMKDEELWLMGMYTLSAVSVAVEKNLAGKKAKGQYPDKPYTHQIKDKQIKADMTEEEKEKATQQLFYSLQIMQSNYELSNRGKGRK